MRKVRSWLALIYFSYFLILPAFGDTSQEIKTQKELYSGKPILFVGGYSGREILRPCLSYMRDFEAEAVETYCMNTGFHGPNSGHGIDEHLEWIRDEILYLYKKFKTPIYVFPHSLGAPATVASILKYSLKDQVEDVLSLQGCFGGSFVAGHNLPWYFRMWNLSFFRDRYFGRGLQNAKTHPRGENPIHKLLAHLIYKNHNPKTEEGRAYLEDLNDKIHYIVTEIPKSDLSWIGRISHSVSFNSTELPNDGLLLLEHQAPNGEVIASLLNRFEKEDQVGIEEGEFTLEKYPHLALGRILFQDTADHVELTTDFYDIGQPSKQVKENRDGRRGFFKKVMTRLELMKKTRQQIVSRL